MNEATIKGAFGELVIERDLFDDPTSDTFQHYRLGYPPRFYLNGEPISRERAEEILNAESPPHPEG